MSFEPVAVVSSIILLGSMPFVAQMTPESVVGWKELGAVGVMGFALLWLLTKTIPAMNKQYADSLEKIVTSFQKEMHEQRLHDGRQGDEQEKRFDHRHADLMQAIKEKK